MRGPWRNESLAVLSQMLRSEADPDVLANVIITLATLDYSDFVDTVVPLASHPDWRIRYAVARGLQELSPGLFLSSDRAVSALITLAQDPSADVREAATSTLEDLDVDTPAVREALFALANEPNDDIRGLAWMGLARRSDPRVVALLREKLNAETGIGNLEVQAAELSGDPSLVDGLEGLRGWWPSDQEDSELLERAIGRCRSGRAGATP